MARARVRILLVLVALAGIAVATDALGIIGTGSAQTEPPGTPLPGASWKATKTSATSVSTGGSIKGPPFAWGVGFTTAPKSAQAGPAGFCLFVTVDGPLFRTPQGALVGGPGGESGGSKCGPINPKTGLINTASIKGGSIKQPNTGATETWQAFDIGTAAYSQSVDKVRLRFAGGGSTVLPLRRMPAAVRPKSWEPFRYVSFAVYGCVNEVEGLSGRRAVARMHQMECGG